MSQVLRCVYDLVPHGSIIGGLGKGLAWPNYSVSEHQLFSTKKKKPEKILAPLSQPDK